MFDLRQYRGGIQSCAIAGSSRHQLIWTPFSGPKLKNELPRQRQLRDADAPHALRMTGIVSKSKVNLAAGLVSKIRGNQIVRSPASADIDLGCGGTDQVTVGIERVQQARFTGAGIRLNPPQCAFVYEK